MRYARGMFRLWLVASCLWIALVATITYSNWPSPTVPEQASKYDSNGNYIPEYMKDDPFVPLWEKKQDPPSVLVRFAAELGYDVTVIKDATADYSDEHMHAALDLNLPSYAGAIVTANAVVESISSL